MFELVMMQAAVTQSPPPEAVDAVTVTGAKAATRRLPPWSEDIRPQGWPFMGGVDDRSILVFAKAAVDSPGSPYQQVWVRHEYRAEQIDSIDATPLPPYRSERLVQEVDCGHQTFRTLKAYRYSANNLEGRQQTLSFTDLTWTTPEPGAFDATIVRAACFEP